MPGRPRAKNPDTQTGWARRETPDGAHQCRSRSQLVVVPDPANTAYADQLTRTANAGAIRIRSCVELELTGDKEDGQVTQSAE